MPEWLKGADCKSVGYAYAGSNPAPSISLPQILYMRIERLSMSYVDGFVAAVPTKNKEKFVKHAEICAEVFKEFGALNTVECWGDDVPDGEVTSFPMAVNKAR